MNTLFETSGAVQAQLKVFTISLDAVLGTVSDGAVTFSLALQGPGLGGLPGSTLSTGAFVTEFNSAGLDFSTLELTETGTSIPAPGSAILLGIGLLAAACSSGGRRRDRAVDGLSHPPAGANGRSTL